MLPPSQLSLPPVLSGLGESQAIQLLCQTTNPLSTCMDQLQEDMENMHKELSFWSGERTQYSAKLLEEQKATSQVGDRASQCTSPGLPREMLGSC